jgi:hypothetical protein
MRTSLPEEDLARLLTPYKVHSITRIADEASKRSMRRKLLTLDPNQNFAYAVLAEDEDNACRIKTQPNNALERELDLVLAQQMVCMVGQISEESIQGLHRVISSIDADQPYTIVLFQQNVSSAFEYTKDAAF